MSARFILKPYAVEAVCFTAADFEKSMDFCKELGLVITRAYEPDRLVGLLATQSGVETVEIGDWIVRRQGTFVVIRADDFWDLYAREDAVSVSA
jgi:hypothetical protein